AVLPSIFTITGLALTSATFASAAAVLTPLITFVLAASLRQVKVSKLFGGAYWNATLMNLTGSVVAVIIALCWNCDLKEWKLGWNIRLFTIAYASIVMSGMVIAVNAWCVESRGPLFVSVFSPVALVVVALVGSFILNETLHVGS
ncbi:hypothetical protein F2Q69_00020152, partial [Brassica cretica]